MSSARLKALPPRMATLSSLMPVGREASERARSKERIETTPYVGWYKSAAWQKLREQVLVRDLYTCRQTGVLLTGKHPAPNSPVVDHIKPHRGNYEMFWDIDNLQLVSKRWHDGIKQAIEKADQKASAHPPWLKPSLIPLTIVCGPIASGKSAYVKANAGSKDLVIDLDVIASQISGEPLHGWDRGQWLNAALWRRNDLLGSLSRPSDYEAAWFIVSEPKARHREWWDQTLRPQRIVVMETDERQCLAYAAMDEGRDLNQVDALATQWWVSYEPRPGEIRIIPSDGC